MKKAVYVVLFCLLMSVAGAYSSPVPIDSWNLDNNGGSPDVSSYNGDHYLTPVSAPTLDSTGIPAGLYEGAEYDGSNDYHQVGNNTDFDFVNGDDWSIELWIRPDTSGTYETITSRGTIGTTGVNFLIQIINTGEVRFCTSMGCGSGDYVDGTTSLSANKIAHIVVTHDSTGTEGNSSIYINGSRDGQDTTDDPFTSTANMRFGERDDGAQGFDGSIFYVALYDTALTTAEVSALYSGATQYEAAGPSGVRSYTMDVTNLYNDSGIAGATVTFAAGCTNTTNASGLAVVTNETAGCSALSGDLTTVTVAKTSYTFNQSTYTIHENGTGNASAYEAAYNISVYKLLTGVAVNTPYNITTGPGKTYADGENVYLKNGTNTLTFSKNTINDTYYNLTDTVTVTYGTGTANLTGAYDLVVTVRVEDANGNLLEENGSINITGDYTYNAFLSNYSAAYANGSLNFTLLRNLTFNISADPATYAEDYGVVWINGSLPVYVYPLNLTLYRERTFNLSLYDEITGLKLNGTNFTLELISDLTAGEYNVTDGDLALELLTPSDYTIRYRSSGRPERDYYETISSESFFTIFLYSLTAANATDVIVSVEETSGAGIQGATVQLLRYFIDCNCYRVVEMAKSGYDGKTYLVAQEVEGHYKWLVEYEGRTEFISSNPENLIADPITGQIEKIIRIDLGGDYYESYTNMNNIDYTTAYNENTQAR